ARPPGTCTGFRQRDTLMNALPSLPPATAVRWQTLLERLGEIARRHPDAVVASSLAAEDMVLTHAIYSTGLPLEIFTLDTGRLHRETLDLLDEIQGAYGRAPTVHHPQAEAAHPHVAAPGAFAFCASPALPQACCNDRAGGALKPYLAR